MELKCTNPNGEIVLARKLNYVEIFLEKLCKLHLEMNPTSYFFKRMLRLPKKQDCP